MIGPRLRLVAMVVGAGLTLPACRPAPAPPASVWDQARASGVGFRAIGQEPGWYLEIRDADRIRFVYAYGEREVSAPAPAPTVREAGRTVYETRADGRPLTVVITAEPCADVMSGEPFESSVVVELDGETYRGCGRLLR